MPNYKHVVKVHPSVEKRLYRVMKELERDGESVIDSMDREWHGVMRKFAINTKTLVGDGGFLEKTWVQRDDSNVVQKRLIRIKKDSECVEIPGNDISFFHFKRRRLI